MVTCTREPEIGAISGMYAVELGPKGLTDALYGCEKVKKMF